MPLNRMSGVGKGTSTASKLLSSTDRSHDTHVVPMHL
jgi:hypothetical protein